MLISKKMRLPFAVGLLVVFNALDAFFTLKYIKFGALCEANPLMDTLLQSNHHLFIFYKLIVVNFCVLALYKNNKGKIIPFVLYLFAITYSLLMIWWGYLIFLLY